MAWTVSDLERPAEQPDEFQGFDPRGTLSRRRAPSSSNTSHLSRSLTGKSAQSPSALDSGILRRSSLLRKSSSPNPQPPPQRQLGFPSPSISPDTSFTSKAVSGLPASTPANVPCSTDSISATLASQSFFSPPDAAEPAASAKPAPLVLDDTQQQLHRGRKSARPAQARHASESSIERSSRSRSRHASCLRDQLLDRDSSRGRSPAAFSSMSPISSTYNLRSGSSKSKSRERTSTEVPWSPAQEFLNSLGRRAGSADAGPHSLIDSVVSLASDKLSKGIEIDGWQIGRFLGAGSFGQVRTCMRLEGPSISTGEAMQAGQYASVKIVPLASDAELQREIDIWANLPPHPAVIPLLGVHSTDTESYVFMPLCEGGNLLEYLTDFGEQETTDLGPMRSRGRRSVSARYSNSSVDSSMPQQQRSGGLPLPLARHVFGQIVTGLAHLHANSVTHCDVKLENILLDNASGHFRLADFGLAQAHAAEVESEAIMAEMDGRPQSFTEGFMAPSYLESAMQDASPRSRQPSPTPIVDAPAGSLEYAAPERLKTLSSADLKPSVDIWALGCVLYALLSGKLPFQDEFEPRLRMKILKGNWDIPKQLMRVVEREQSEALLKLLQGCLCIDPQQRWSIKQVQQSEWLATAWDVVAPLLDEHSSFRASPTKRAASRSRSRGRRPLAIDTANSSPIAVFTDHRDYSPYQQDYFRRRSSSRESSSSQRRLSAPSSSVRLPDMRE